MDWMVNGIFTSDCAIFRYRYFGLSSVTFSRLCVAPPLPPECVGPEFGVADPALRCGSIICSTSSQSQWMWHYVERYRTSVRNQNLFLFMSISFRAYIWDHGDKTPVAVHPQSSLPAIHLNVDISNLYTKTNGKRQQKATHYGSVK